MSDKSKQVESIVPVQESSAPVSESDGKTKPEKPKRKFVASLKSNIRQLGTTVGLKMSKQPKQGSFNDPTQSSELKKKKNKRQKQEEFKTSLSTESEPSVGAKPKASKVVSNIVKKLSVDQIHQPFIGQQYAGPSVNVSVSGTPPVSPDADVRSTSSSEISYDSPVRVPRVKQQSNTEALPKEQPAGSTSSGDSRKPLEDLILQTQQFADSLAPQSPEQGKSLLAEFIEAEAKSNSNKTDDIKSAKTTGEKSKVEQTGNKDDENNKDVKKKHENKDVKNEGLQEKKSYKKSEKEGIENVKEGKDGNAQGENVSQKEDLKYDKSKKSAPAPKEDNRRSDEVEKQLLKFSNDDTEVKSDDKLKQKLFTDSERKESVENSSAKRTGTLSPDTNKSEKRKSVQDGDGKEIKHIKIDQDKDSESDKGVTKETTDKNSEIKIEEKPVDKNIENEKDYKGGKVKAQTKKEEKPVHNNGEKEITDKSNEIKKEEKQIDKNIEKEKPDKDGNFKAQTKKEDKPVHKNDNKERTDKDGKVTKAEPKKLPNDEKPDKSVTTTGQVIPSQSTANTVVDKTSGDVRKTAGSDKDTPTSGNSVVNPLNDPSTVSPGKLSSKGTPLDSTSLPKTPEAVLSSPRELPSSMTQIPDKRECLYKILVIGELGTGKTSIIKRYVHQFFSQHYRATIGVDFALKVINWDQNTIIRLQLWDIAGQERFGNMTRVYYKEAVGAFIVFDVTRSATFDAVLKWKQDLDAKVQLADGASIPCVLLANKCDQQKEGIVNNAAKMEEYCKEHNFSGWFETSAKENINIDEAAKNLVNQILQNDKVSQNGKEMRDGSKFPLDGKGDQQENKSCAC